MRMRNITLVGFFTVLLAASFSAGFREREGARNPPVGPTVSERPEDTPITISDGSPLRIQIKKARWIKHRSNEIGPDVSGTVTEVSITPESHPLNLCVDGSECEVDITYGTIQLQVTTDLDGQLLRVKTIPGTFAENYDTPGPAPNTYTSKIKDARISLVIVKRAGVEVRKYQPPDGTTTTITINHRKK